MKIAIIETGAMRWAHCQRPPATRSPLARRKPTCRCDIVWTTRPPNFLTAGHWKRTSAADVPVPGAIA